MRESKSKIRRLEATMKLATQPKGFKGDLKKELGNTGTSISGGRILQDPNPDFYTYEGVKIYDEMRRTDPMVRATIEMVRRPIMSAPWRIQPVDQEDELEVEKANFVHEALERRMERPFSDLLSEILLFPFFGFYYFEKVFKVEDGKIWWEKWGSRIPTAHYKWEMHNGDSGVTQQLPYAPKKDGEYQNTQPEIPMNKLILFIYQKEGDNYDGFPILRTAYRAYYTKDILYKIQAIRSERAAGILVVGLPESHSDQDAADAEEMGRNFKEVESSYIVKPSTDWTIEILTAGIADKTSDIAEAIKHHNEMIAMNILGQFIMLGTGGGGGSYALSRDQSDFFVLGLKEITKQVEAVINKQAIEELVKLNYGESEAYPKLVFDQIGQIDYQEMSTTLATLASAGYVKVDDNMQIWTRKMFGLPELTKEELEEQAEAPEAEDAMPEDGGEEMDDQTDIDTETEDALGELDDLEAELSENTKKKIYKFGVKGQPLDEETKRKISEALKKGGSSDDDPELKKRKLRLNAIKGGIANLRDQVKKLKDEGKLNPAKKAAIKKQIEAIRAQITANKETQKKARDEVNARKQVLRLKKAIEKGREKQAKLEERKSKTQEAIAKKQDRIKEIQDKLNNATGEKKEKLKARLEAATQSVAKSEEGLAKIDTDMASISERMGRLEKLGKRAGLSEIEQFVKFTESIQEMHFCECDDKAYAFAFKPFRELTFAEERVKFAEVSGFFDINQENVRKILDNFIADQKSSLLSKIEQAIKNKDIVAIRDLSLKGIPALKSKLKEEAKNALEHGKSQAAGELGIETPSTPAVVTQVANAQIDQMVDEYSSAIINPIKTSALNSVSNNIGVGAAMFEAKQVLNDSSKSESGAIAAILTGTLVNTGRSVVFDIASDQIYALQRSEILDDATCAICMSIDGRIVDERSPFAKLGEVHSNCRGIWVAILNDDPNPPSIGDIPKSIKSRFETTEGVPSVNNFRQLKQPIFTKNSRLQQKINDGKIDIQ